jgi:hypothetical protein
MRKPQVIVLNFGFVWGKLGSRAILGKCVPAISGQFSSEPHSEVRERYVGVGVQQSTHAIGHFSHILSGPGGQGDPKHRLRFGVVGFETNSLMELLNRGVEITLLNEKKT